ncbi:MAG: hypothetical protein RLN76_01705 [Phycisphaeraceae bacterium]
MTTDSHNLLRMLEPAVRPDQTQAPKPAGAPTFENQSFDQLLQQAAQTDEQDQAEQATKPTAQRLLEALSTTENASVRRLMEAPTNPRPSTA